jgi:hypothetical protein
MQLNPVRFVMLQFSRHPASPGVTLLILQSNGQTPLEVLVRPDWKKWVDGADHAFLSELMNEWMSIPPTEISPLLDELCRQSMGPLRLIRRGTLACT